MLSGLAAAWVHRDYVVALTARAPLVHLGSALGRSTVGPGRTQNMKLKLLLGAIAIVVALHFLNRWLNETPRYMEESPSTGMPANGEVRQKMIVGFLPVT